MTDKLKIVIPLYPDVTHLDFTGPQQFLSRLPHSASSAVRLGSFWPKRRVS